MCTWPTKFCTSIWASLQGKRSHSRSSRVCNLEPKASLSVKPLMWPQSRQLQESPMAQRSWRDAPRLGEQWACQRHSMGLKRHSFTVWTSGANEQSFLRLWYNTSTLILFGPSNFHLTWDNNKNVCLNVGCGIHHQHACATSWTESEFGLKSVPI